jgi:hypothetical protein
MNPKAINMVSISPDGESIQEAVDEITVKGTIYLTWADIQTRRL